MGLYSIIEPHLRGSLGDGWKNIVLSKMRRDQAGLLIEIINIDGQRSYVDRII